MSDKFSNKRWKDFEISEIFEVYNSTPYHTKDINKNNIGIPYVTRTAKNNGLEDIIDENEFAKNPGNVISFGAESAIFFYQEFEYITGNKMYYITNQNMNKYIGIFLVNSLQYSIKNSGFGYGKGLTGTRLIKRKLMLPIDYENNPDWKFMEDYVKQERQKLVDKVVGYYADRNNRTVKSTIIAENDSFDVFKFSEVFTSIQRGKRLKKSDHVNGDIPYVSSTSLNNGVDAFIGKNDNARMFENNLSIANSGSVGSSFYHKYEYVASDHVTGLRIHNGDKHTYLYLATMTNRLEEKYSFNREINNARIMKEKIFLPVLDSKNVDYDSMRNKMIVLEYSMIERIINYFTKK